MDKDGNKQQHNILKSLRKPVYALGASRPLTPETGFRLLIWSLIMRSF